MTARPKRHYRPDALAAPFTTSEDLRVSYAVAPFDHAVAEAIVGSQHDGGMIGLEWAERCYQHQPGPYRNRPLEGSIMADSKPICSVAGCGNISYLKSLCNAHYLRQRRHGDPLAGGPRRLGEPLAWLKALVAAPPQICVEWPFASNGNGYGWAQYEGKRFGAHRLSLFLATGELPPRMDAAHSCHNRACVNPAHLSWKTRNGNSLDRRRDGTAGIKLSVAQAETIRASDDRSTALAAAFGVCVSTIQKIRSGKLWVPE